MENAHGTCVRIEHLNVEQLDDLDKIIAIFEYLCSTALRSYSVYFALMRQYQRDAHYVVTKYGTYAQRTQEELRDFLSFQDFDNVRKRCDHLDELQHIITEIITTLKEVRDFDGPVVSDEMKERIAIAIVFAEFQVNTRSKDIKNNDYIINTIEYKRAQYASFRESQAEEREYFKDDKSLEYATLGNDAIRKELDVLKKHIATLQKFIEKP